MHPLMVSGDSRCHVRWRTALKELLGESGDSSALLCICLIHPYSACSQLVLRQSCNTSLDSTHIASNMRRNCTHRQIEIAHFEFWFRSLTVSYQYSGLRLLRGNSYVPIIVPHLQSVFDSLYGTSQLLAFIAINRVPCTLKRIESEAFANFSHHYQSCDLQSYSFTVLQFNF